jgi:hypothetical protein
MNKDGGAQGDERGAVDIAADARLLAEKQASVPEALQTLINEGFVAWPDLIEELAFTSRRDSADREIPLLAERLLDDHGFRRCADVLSDKRVNTGLPDLARRLIENTRTNVSNLLRGRTDYDVGGALMKCAHDLRRSEPWLPIDQAARLAGLSVWQVRKWPKRKRNSLPVRGEDGLPLQLLTPGETRLASKPLQVRLSDLRAVAARRDGTE